MVVERLEKNDVSISFACVHLEINRPDIVYNSGFFDFVTLSETNLF